MIYNEEKSVFQSANHVDHYIHYKTQIPKNLDLRTVKGEILLREEGLEVRPVEKSDNIDLIENSKKLILKSAVSYPYERRVRQVKLSNFYNI
jgi:hypothetical protein